MVIPRNLESIHAEDERLRKASVKMISGSSALKDHISAIHASMGLIFAIDQGHEHRSADEKTIQYLGLRIFNSCASVLKLGLSGYYQSAFALVRDVFETVLLIDYFRSEPSKIAVWESSNRKQRMKEFGPASLRKALDKRDGFTEGRRKVMYDQLSEYASHATAPGFRLVAPEGLGNIGPFLSEKYLKALIEELVKYAVHAGIIFSGFFDNVSNELILEKLAFVEHINGWRHTYFGASGQDAT